MNRHIEASRPRNFAACMLGAAVLLFVTPASAEYITGFENLSGASNGVVVTGQDGYYLPADVTSTDWKVYTYADNTLGLPTNPTGDSQFIGGTSLGLALAARCQRDVSFLDDTEWEISWDFAGTFLGSGASAQNLGSFALSNPDAAIFNYIHLMTWVDVANPTLFNAYFLAYDASGVQFSQPGVSPGQAWSNLPIDRWYRAWTQVDLLSNLIVEVGITDLTTGTTSSFNPVGWYLAGGSAGAAAMPTAIRFFAGGAEGNAVGFDNVDIHPTGAVLVESATWGKVKALFQ